MSDTQEPNPDAGEIAPEVEAPAPEIFGCPYDEYLGQLRLYVPGERLVEVCDELRRAGYWQCIDLCVVDYLTHPGRNLPEGIEAERFEIVINLIDHNGRAPGNGTGRIRLRVQVPESNPTLPSLFAIWPGVDQMEREAFDLFGINFEGHPGLTRILLPDDWTGHPLRKDVSLGRIPVQFTAGSTDR